MKIKLNICLILLSLFGLTLHNQAQQVINSGGSDRQLGNSSIYIGDNIGEPFIESFGPGANFMITQGYLQPNYVVKPVDSPNTYTLDGITNPISCKNKKDAYIELTAKASVSSFTALYYWSPNKYCLTNNCTKIDSLSPGNYSVAVVFYYNNKAGILKSDTVRKTYTISDTDIECGKLNIFSGVTPNNDGLNETWVIDDIENYPNNKVTIYNRWGFEVFKTDKYDNKTNNWPSKEDLPKLNSTTYFYILDLGDGSPPRKAWIELIKD